MNTVTNAIELLQGPSSSVSLPTQICAWATGIILSAFALGVILVVVSVVYAVVKEIFFSK